MTTAPRPRKKVHAEVDAEESPRLVSYRDAAELCDAEILRRVLDFGKHHRTGGRRPQPFWVAEDFEDCLGLVEFETRGGLS